jgi:hypothetical protein
MKEEELKRNDGRREDGNEKVEGRGEEEEE